LISGDRITVHGKGKLAVEPRKGVHFLRYAAGDHQYVIPSDALPLLRDGRLDRRLFDVTGLLNFGYDKRKDLPIIVTGTGLAKGFQAQKHVKDGLKAYWANLKTSSGTEKVWLDGIRKPSLDVSVPQIGAPAAWQAGLDGTGVKVAVLDTGIDAAHPDLAGKIAAAQNFAADAEDALDHVGHGTHVASTIAGSGAASAGKYKGVAPGATLLDGKVCAEFGCLDSWILGGMQWAAENGAQVINMSLGGQDSPELDPIEAAVNDLTAQYGTLFVIAAGNSGFGGEYTLSSPASADAALAVGAVFKDNSLAPFSSRGPRVGDSAVKPEITGPGVGIVAARSKDGFLGEPGQSYMPLSGTSMATPHVAGAAAILTQQHPQWTAKQRKTALTGSASPTATDGPFQQGAGRVDVARAIAATVSPAESAVSFGVQPFPHDDDPVLVKDVTYNNAGTADVTLQLSLSDTAGGTFSLSASSVTVPAGGSASVSLASDTRGGTKFGPIGGRITATAAGIAVQVPYGVDREDQKFTIALPQTGRDGNPADLFFSVAINLETGKDYLMIGDAQTSPSLKIPGGLYLIFSWIDEISEEAGYQHTTQLFWPKLAINSDRTVSMDARLAGPVDITVPDATAIPLIIDVTGIVEHNGRSVSVGAAAGDPGTLFAGHLGPKPVPGVSATSQAIFGHEKAPGELDPSVLYNLAWIVNDGAFFTGFTKHVAKKDLATVTYDVATHATDQGVIVQIPSLPGGSWAVSIPMTLPTQRTDYLSGGIEYQGEFDEIFFGEEPFPETVSSQITPDRTYTPGRTVHERYNRAVFGTTFPDIKFPDVWLTRNGDTIFITPPLFSDAGGHAGFGQYKSARTAIYRNGTLLGEVPTPFADFPVPSEQATYRIESSIERGAPARLSTSVKTTWTVKSAHTTDWAKLPVSAVSFSPFLSDENTAPAGAPMLIPATVWQQPGAKPGRTIAVDVSYDDGATWSKAKVISILGLHFVLLKNPSKAGFVSLRASTADFSQTIIHAYEVR
jgi:subtilisin family serine protease